MLNGIKSVNPKISRIGRQKRKSNFFLFSLKEPIWLTIFGNDIKRFHFLFFSPKFAKPKIRPQGLQQRPWGLKFGTCSTCSFGRTKRCLNMSFTQFLRHLLNLTWDLLLFKNVLFYKVASLRKLNHLRTLSDKANIAKIWASQMLSVIIQSESSK